MAATNEQIKKLVQQRATDTSSVLDSAQPAAVQTTPYTGLSGVSENTQSVLGKYSAGYTPSETVTKAQDYLNSVVAGKPGSYSSSYKQQLDNLYNQVMNRPKFQYNLNEDMLYNQYKDQYQLMGQQAMMDTTAQAAALTGGYGNSYAATAGNQAYQAYLQQLNNLVPDLYAMAMNQYAQEGEQLNNQYAMTADLENQDYSRYQQDYNNWMAEHEMANSNYWNQYNADYGQYSDMMNYWTQMAAQENAQYNTDREMAYNQAMAILSTGKTPSSALLEAAGISSADAKKLAAAYKKSSSSGGGGRSSSSGGSTNPGNNNTQQTSLGAYANTLINSIINQNNTEGLLWTEVDKMVNQSVKNGYITGNEAAEILNILEKQIR